MAAEFMLKNLPIRVCGVAPGVYDSGMTSSRLAKDGPDAIALGLQPVPAKRAGTYVLPSESGSETILISRTCAALRKLQGP